MGRNEGDLGEYIMIIAVDFDGTLCEHAFPAIGDEKPGAIDMLKRLQKEGHQIILWTCREGVFLIYAIQWLKDKGFVPDAVNENLRFYMGNNCRKVEADLYWDDKGKEPPWFKSTWRAYK